MKYCKFCGKELADNETCFCADSVKRTKVIKIGAVIAATVVAVALVVTLILSLVSGSESLSKISAMDYLDEPVFSGLDGYGTATVSFDKNALIISVIGEEPDNVWSKEYQEWCDLYDEYTDNIICEYPTGNLKNGDAFDLQIVVTGIAAEKVLSGGRHCVVKGLTEVSYYDYFVDISLAFSGVSGDAWVSVERGDALPYIDVCRFSVSPNSGLKNGDTITVSITNADALLQRYAVAPATISKEFVVSGLDTYASAVDLP